MAVNGGSKMQNTETAEVNIGKLKGRQQNEDNIKREEHEKYIHERKVRHADSMGSIFHNALLKLHQPRRMVEVFKEM